MLDFADRTASNVPMGLAKTSFFFRAVGKNKNTIGQLSYREVVWLMFARWSLGLPITAACMKRLAFRSDFLSSYSYFLYELKRSINHRLPNVLYTMLAVRCFYSFGHITK